MHQLDVDSVFPYADLKEDVNMTPPLPELLKSLYGLKQAPRNWHKLFIDHIKSIGFKQCMLDNCLFVNVLYLISLFVDDILMVEPGRSEARQATIHRPI